MIAANRGKLGAIDLADLDMLVADTRFIENIAPKDALIVDYNMAVCEQQRNAR